MSVISQEPTPESVWTLMQETARQMRETDRGLKKAEDLFNQSMRATGGILGRRRPGFPVSGPSRLQNLRTAHHPPGEGMSWRKKLRIRYSGYRWGGTGYRGSQDYLAARRCDEVPGKTGEMQALDAGIRIEKDPWGRGLSSGRCRSRPDGGESETLRNPGHGGLGRYHKREGIRTTELVTRNSVAPRKGRRSYGFTGLGGIICVRISSSTVSPCYPWGPYFQY